MNFKFVEYFLNDSPIKCFVNKNAARDTVLFLTGSGGTGGAAFGLFNVFETAAPTSANFCELLGDIGLQEQAETYVQLVPNSVPYPEVVTGHRYYGETRRAPGFNVTNLQAIVLSTMDALEADNYAIPNRYSLMGFSSGTSNWLNAVIVSQPIVDRCMSLGANIGSMSNIPFQPVHPSNWCTTQQTICN